MNLKNIVLCFAVFFLTACGGGGGSGSGGEDSSYSISLDRTQVNFTADIYGITSGNVIVNVQFKGDGVIVGYPPQVPEPTWLSVSSVSSTSNSATYNLSVFPGNTPNNYTTTLRFITGKADGSKIKYVDLPVSLSIKESFSASAMVSQFNFESIGRKMSAITPASYQIDIRGTDTNWKIEATNWVTLNKISGKGMGTVTIGVNPELAAYGSNTGVIKIADSVSNKIFNFNVNYQLNHADVSVDTKEHHFIVDELSSDSDLTASFNIVDGLNGASAEDVYTWEYVSSSADWISLREKSGNTAQGAKSPEIIINKNLLLNNRSKGERYEATLTIKTQSNFASAREYTINVSAFIKMGPAEFLNAIPYQLNYTVDQAVFAPTVHQLFISDKTGRRLYVVDTNSGKTTYYYSFNEMPESLSVSPDGHYLFVALLNHEHDYFQNYPGGKIAIIDLSSGLLINKFDIDIDPWDVEGTDNAKVYVSAGSGQSTWLKRYNCLTGELDIIGSSRHRITLALYKDQQTIYTVTTDSSPGDITKYYPQFWNSNEFLNFVDSPYHGEYDIGNKLWIEPSGNNIFTEWGNVFKVGDLIFVKKVLPSGVIAKELAFDSTNNRVVLIERNFNGVTDVISSYDLPEYDNYQVLKTGASAAQFIFNDNGHILLIEKTENGYQIRKI